MDLSELTDRPELTVSIGGRAYHFSEAPIDRLADCQDYLRRTVPHPVQAIRPHLEGLKAEDRQALLENARREARDWPPQAGTSAGMLALCGTEGGQLAALAAGLSVHHAGLSPADVKRIYRELQREALREARRRRKARGDAPAGDDDGEGLVKRIFSVIFGFGDPDLEADDDRAVLPEG